MLNAVFLSEFNGYIILYKIVMYRLNTAYTRILGVVSGVGPMSGLECEIWEVFPFPINQYILHVIKK